MKLTAHISSDSSFVSKRKVLVIEDDRLNNEILSNILSQDYDVIKAYDGAEGLKTAREYADELSLIFLDVYMPVLNGFEFLVEQASDKTIANIPVVVTTRGSAAENEIRCLELGAIDFVGKPYNAEIVRARARNIIHLRDSVSALNDVEYDELTGYLSMPAFEHHMQSIINRHGGDKFNLVVADIYQFKNINSIYGYSTGDEVLKVIARIFRHFASVLICARKDDKFFFMCSGEFRPDINSIDLLNNAIRSKCPVPNIIIKYGIYVDIDKSLPAKTLIDRTIVAANLIKSDITVNYSLFNEDVHKRLLRDTLLERKFERGINNNEFRIWFQPKIDPTDRKIIGAEALVRWVTSDGEIICPGEFITLFEKDGYIWRLDEYIFRKACEFQKERKDKGLETVPVSVNLSRNSILFNHISERYSRIIEEIGTPYELVKLEITESAANEGITVAAQARMLSEKGFRLEMDDFGAGYSSISGLVGTDFEDVKIDKTLVDKIGVDRGEIVINYVIKLAHEMGMNVIAEGVETAAQVEFLRNAGCDFIQGYYYYKPVSEETFVKLIDKK